MRIPRLAHRAVQALPSSSLGELHQRIGADDFYLKVATLDPANAAKWRQMAVVQKTFKDAEPSYPSNADRTYSESNRETLHRVTIELLKNKQPGQNVYREFISLHPTVFKENGACKLPLQQQVEILSHTEPSMFSPKNTALLLNGLVHDEPWRPLVKQAADATRAARTAQGLPVTVSAYH